MNNFGDEKKLLKLRSFNLQEINCLNSLFTKVTSVKTKKRNRLTRIRQKNRSIVTNSRDTKAFQIVDKR